MPTILHLDLDAFYASVEQLKNPALRGRPVIVGTSVVASCSYEARKFGLHSEMPVRDALRLCPGAVVVEGDAYVYGCYSQMVWELCRRWLPEMETFIDECYGDLTGTSGVYDDPLRVGAELRASIKREIGLSATVGIATNKMIAKMAGSDAKPDGLAVVEPGREEAYIVDRPLRDLPGIGPVTERLFRDMNIKTARDLQGLSAPVLRAMLGKNGEALYERCRGRDPRPVREQRIPGAVSREAQLPGPTSSLALVRAYFQYLAERALRHLRKGKLEARQLHVRIQYEDREGGGEATHTFERPTAIDEDVLPWIWTLFGKLHQRRVNLRRVGVAFSRLSPPQVQLELFGAPRDVKAERLHSAIDAIRDRYGYSSIVAGRSILMKVALEQTANGFVLPAACRTH